MEVQITETINQIAKHRVHRKGHQTTTQQRRNGPRTSYLYVSISSKAASLGSLNSDILYHKSESEETQEYMPVILDGNQISQTAFSSFPDTKYGTVVWQTLLSKPSTCSDSMCVGIATCPSNGTLALHQHSQAEVYYVLEGSGQVEIDGVRHHVKAGTVLWIPGNAMHGAFCGPDETLKWLYVFPESRFEDIIYRFQDT